MFLLITYFFGLVILVSSLWYPLMDSIVFIVVVGLLEIYLLSSQYFVKTEEFIFSFNFFPVQLSLSEKEKRVFQKYHIFFRYPFISKIISSIMSGIQVSVIFWLPWLLYNHLWISAVVIGLNYFVAGPLIATKLDPRFFLHDAVERLNKKKYSEEMMLVDSICEKVSKIREANFEKENN